ncbi:hypothetical protein [Planosporangium mesophilum]|uniref:Uncharacterized protein n=1 Tax=Planosporangium mesophilum TaxID=689768 RepID=A0A8J3TCN8_9ACTN|nr:hypothetical protein [Planosporangium mesophilum]NJC83912.1 hypothetical protein [Planosporangium mesophilum]GII22722.1 hypothetical protein Pme01_23190 [Planosporangium mesophilum]
MTTVTPDRCLAAADQMLRATGPLGATAVAAGWWPKACACLIRLALEGGIDAFWQRLSPPVAVCANGRTKHLMLRRYDRTVARRVSFAWAALSSATHHHCYEMAPTAGELRRLHTEVTALLATLNGPELPS